MSTQAQRRRNKQLSINIIMLVSGICVGTYYSGNVPAILNAFAHLWWMFALAVAVLYCAHAFASGIIVGIREARKDKRNDVQHVAGATPNPRIRMSVAGLEIHTLDNQTFSVVMNER